MKNSGLIADGKWCITENNYDLSTEPNVASLLTTGNGYIGIRGSLEEYGSLRIQGCYIRGVIDSIVDMRLPFCDNMYMKKYYFNEDKLKKFEHQECIINLIDFLLIRFTVDGETFYPWEGKVLEWKRTLDMKNNCLTRYVLWENEKGDITEFRFERFSSFADDHIYAMKASCKPINHNKPISVMSGLDCRTKTYGQHTTVAQYSKADKNCLLHELLAGNKYKFACCTGVKQTFSDNCNPEIQSVCDEDFIANIYSFNTEKGETYTIEKKIYIITSRDTDENLRQCVENQLEALSEKSYDMLFTESKKEYDYFFNRINVDIEGDDEADNAVRFSNYHTLISIDRNDAVHSLSAKGLTGEVYNNFVWWDAEVYQSPVFMHTMPELVANTLIYRYNKLDAARKIAVSEGRKGARFPFTSAVTGEETVWAYTRHPFLQIHIVSDIGLAVLRYFTCTGDIEFIKKYGLEMLLEISRYWASRVEWSDERSAYVIKCVTGTDEHHPYVDNNAYTNYSVKRVLDETLKLCEEMPETAKKIKEKIGMVQDEMLEIADVAEKLYLPIDMITGMIPQFDGYFDLDRELELQGGSTAKSFQMKQSGLYNKSQVIKQPDVMLLFSYMDMPFNETVYRRNWDYYEARCEASSSLSYPVHAICAADCGQPERAYKYLMKTARLDLDDEHDCAHEGVHAACAAGAWLSVARGIAGMKLKNDGIEINPSFIPWWKSVSFKAEWHGISFLVKLDNMKVTVTVLKGEKSLPVSFMGNKTDIKPGDMVDFSYNVCEKIGEKV